MGMLVTLYLITANLYASVNAPSTRGFSFIEIWVCGVQFPMLMAIVEYGILLFKLKFEKQNPNERGGGNSWFQPFGTVKYTDNKVARTPIQEKEDPVQDMKKRFKDVDSLCAKISVFCFTTFNIVYWITGFAHYHH